MKSIILIITLAFATLSFTFNKEVLGVNDNTIELKNYKKPQFPGGAKMLSQFLAKNISYPKEAVQKGIQGKVYAEFTINTDGTVSNARIYRGIGGGCDEETIRVIMSMPKWKPAEQNGKKIKVKQSLPVQFFMPRNRR
ncbi:energy transducer TonB [bacterium]|nr:energy transducer TonB [bacterium]MDB4089148.1 energy transducer TonB [Flavobacteriales bacterium]